MEQTETSLMERCRAEEDTLADLRCALRNELRRAGLRDIVVPEQLQNSELMRDPYDRSSTLVGEWRNRSGKTLGAVVIHENGQVIGELYVVKPLPSDPRWLVDAVVAFGRAGELHAELRLMPAPE